MPAADISPAPCSVPVPAGKRPRYAFERHNEPRRTLQKFTQLKVPLLHPTISGERARTIGEFLFMSGCREYEIHAHPCA